MVDFKRLSTEEKLQFITDELKKRVDEGGEKIVAYSNPKALKKLKEMYPELPVQTMGTWTKQVLNKDVYVYLIEQGIAKSVREACLEKVEHFDSINMKKSRFLLEEYDPEFVEIMEKNRITVLNYERCPWLLKDYYYVLDNDELSPFEGKYWDMYSLVEPETNVKIISKSNMLELLNKKSEKGEKHKDLFFKEGRDKKLKRAMKLFEKCVEQVEEYLDEAGDYNYPTASTYSRLEGDIVKSDVDPDYAADFFDAVAAWAEERYKGTAFESEIAPLRKAYAETYEKILNKDFWFNGEVGVEYTVGLAVAFIIYVDPAAIVEIEYVRDKWEFRGDYSASKRVCLEIGDYGNKVSVYYNHYDAYDM